MINHDNLDLDALKINYLDTTHFGDYIIKVEEDDLSSPREDDDFTTMVCWHRNYDLGDKHDYDSPQQLIHELSGLYVNLDTDELTDKQYQQCLKAAYRKNVIQPIFMYDHSGIALSTTSFSDRFDSGLLGYIFVSLEDLRKMFKVKRVTKALREKMMVDLTNVVNTYAQYLNNEVYWFNVEKDGEEVDSCGGFYGDQQDDNGYMVKIIKDAIRNDIAQTPQQQEMF